MTSQQTLLLGEGFSLIPIDMSDLQPILEVYRQSEDFLALGPNPKASIEMVLSDIENSRKSKAQFFAILDSYGRYIGVLDFIVKESVGEVYLSLIMIARPYRNQGIGTSVLMSLEKYAKDTFGIKVMHAGVQTNNTDTIEFYKKYGFVIDTHETQHPDGTTSYSMKKNI